MLEKIDLSKDISKEEYQKIIDEMKMKLAELQRLAREKKIPVIIVFEGWDAAGKGTFINRLILPLDPRGFTVYPTNAPNQEEKLRPFLWRFWTKTPANGRMAIFDRSWYGRVTLERVDKITKKSEWKQSYQEILAFERQLADAGNIIIKFFLHIDKSEQRKRFKKLQKNPAMKWKVSKEDWKHHKQYETYLAVYEEMIQKTDTDYAPWTIVEATNSRFATTKIFTTVINTLQARLNSPAPTPTRRSVEPAYDRNDLNSSILGKVDLTLSMEREEYDRELKKCQTRIREIEHEIYVQRIPVLIMYEGWDAAGKGGNIRRLTSPMDPRGYEVVPVAAPNDIEKAHHYLWRFWKEIPKAGHICIFDRTWYGRVMVERIEGFCSEEEWRRAYREINETEEQITSFGGVIVKFWIHISKEEQLRRFEERQNMPHKAWKITDEDWRNREKWDAYREAVNEMLFRTGTTYAPWTIIEGNCKLYARIKALKTVIQAVESKL